jgi:hypothetical protein
VPLRQKMIMAERSRMQKACRRVIDARGIGVGSCALDDSGRSNAILTQDFGHSADDHGDNSGNLLRLCPRRTGARTERSHTRRRLGHAWVIVRCGRQRLERARTQWMANCGCGGARTVRMGGEGIPPIVHGCGHSGSIMSRDCARAGSIAFTGATALAGLSLANLWHCRTFPLRQCRGLDARVDSRAICRN